MSIVRKCRCRAFTEQIGVFIGWISRPFFDAVGRGLLLELIFFKEHICSEFGGVPMPLTGAIPEGRSFFCPHCGALYAVTYSRLSDSDSNVAKCVVCGQIMDKMGFDQGA